MKLTLTIDTENDAASIGSIASYLAGVAHDLHQMHPATTEKQHGVIYDFNDLTIGHWNLDPEKIKYVIEFRSGSFFQNLTADNGGSKSTAQRFDSEEEVYFFMKRYEWLLFAGGMVVPVE